MIKIFLFAILFPFQQQIILKVSKSPKFLILIVGPTAVGKTSTAIKVAKKFRTEILSCDSRQFYKEMQIGTAKPSQEELAEVKHHFVDSLSIHDSYDVKKFEQDALNLLDRLFTTHDVVVMTGGSGLFADAITQGFDPIPEVAPEIRKEIIHEFDQFGLEHLQKEVKKLDPIYFQEVDQKNPQRLMRALEVCRGTGKMYSSFRQKAAVQRPFEVIRVGLEMDRELLYQRIDQRMDLMIDQGLFEEARALHPYRQLNALQTVGYSEIFGYLEKQYDQEEAIRLLKRNSRRYAKRQLTWFKKNDATRWFYPSQEDEILDFISSHLIA
ncbi:tRNA (adenosine(37)-N6)-dimethylallyltransferase MiaA [Algoriphagus namhaensis]